MSTEALAEILLNDNSDEALAENLLNDNSDHPDPLSFFNVQINIEGAKNQDEDLENVPISPTFFRKSAPDAPKSLSGEKVDLVSFLKQNAKTPSTSNESGESLDNAGRSSDPPVASENFSLTLPASAIKDPKKIRTSSFLGKIASALNTGGTKKKEEPTYNIDELISRLLKNKEYTETCCVTMDEMAAICRDVREVILSQPILLDLSRPVNVCGDIHGQYSDLLDLYNLCGDPKTQNYLFLGDYVDRGRQSLETILLQFCYKLKYPETFFLLRGNHECGSINRIYGFYDECKRRCKVKIWKSFIDVFNVMPLAAIIDEKIFCVHGGLSPAIHSMKDIKNLKRPLDIESVGIEADLLWSDPSMVAKHWEINEERGVSFVFGPDQLDSFLTKFKFDLVARAHMVVEDGFEFFHGRKLVTIFSAPNYTGKFDNKGAIMMVDESLKVSFKFLFPKVIVGKRASYSTRGDYRTINGF